MDAKTAARIGLPGPGPGRAGVAATPPDPAADPTEMILAAFDALGPRLRSMIERRIAPRLRGRVDVDLLLREALDRLLRSIEARPPRSAEEARTWIFRKVWSRWYDELRRWHSDARDVGREEGRASEAVELMGRQIGLLTGLDLKERVGRIRALLGPADFTIVELKIVDDMPFPEIAGLVGLTEGAARRRFSRALLKIKGCLSSPFDTHPPGADA